MIVLTHEQSAAFRYERWWTLAHEAYLHLAVEFPEAWMHRDEDDAVRELTTHIGLAWELGVNDDAATFRFLEVYSLAGAALADADDAIQLLCRPEIAEAWPEAREELVAMCRGEDPVEPDEEEA